MCRRPLQPIRGSADGAGSTALRSEDDRVEGPREEHRGAERQGAKDRAAAGPDQKLRFLLSQTLRRDDVCCRYGHDQYLALLMLADPAHTDAVEHRLRAGWKPVNGRLELMFDFGGPLPQIASE